MKAAIIQALLEGESRSGIATRLGVSKSTVTYHAKKIGLGAISKVKYDWVQVAAYATTHGVRETIRHFGMSNKTWNDGIRRGQVKPKPRVLLTKADVLVIGPQNRGTVKRVLRRMGLEAKCSICTISSWLGKGLNMHLDHINGDPLDNREENVRLLCPNCHSQTETYGGRNVRRNNMSLQLT